MTAKHHLEMKLGVSEIISRFQIVWLAQCVPTILKLNWLERFRVGKRYSKFSTKSSTHPHNWKTDSFMLWVRRKKGCEMHQMVTTCKMKICDYSCCPWNKNTVCLQEAMRYNQQNICLLNHYAWPRVKMNSSLQKFTSQITIRTVW